jgi:hypothetical protein
MGYTRKKHSLNLHKCLSSECKHTVIQCGLWQKRDRDLEEIIDILRVETLSESGKGGDSSRGKDMEGQNL